MADMASEGRGVGIALGLGLGFLGFGLAMMLLGSKCPRCRGRVENGAPYCPACGVRLAWPSP